jgi:hypothetical protein
MADLEESVRHHRPCREDLCPGWREVEGERCVCPYSNARRGNIDVAIDLV